MSGILKIVAMVIKRIANLGAGLASYGFGYQPKVPEELE